MQAKVAETAAVAEYSVQVAEYTVKLAEYSVLAQQKQALILACLLSRSRSSKTACLRRRNLSLVIVLVVALYLNQRALPHLT